MSIRVVQFVETLPMTATGKVLRRELRALGRFCDSLEMMDTRLKPAY